MQPHTDCGEERQLVIEIRRGSYHDIATRESAVNPMCRTIFHLGTFPLRRHP